MTGRALSAVRPSMTPAHASNVCSRAQDVPGPGVGRQPGSAGRDDLEPRSSSGRAGGLSSRRGGEVAAVADRDLRSGCYCLTVTECGRGLGPRTCEGMCRRRRGVRAVDDPGEDGRAATLSEVAARLRHTGNSAAREEVTTG